MTYTDQEIQQTAESLKKIMLENLKANQWTAADLQNYIMARIEGSAEMKRGISISIMGHAYRNGWIKATEMIQISKHCYAHRIEVTT